MGCNCEKGGTCCEDGSCSPGGTCSSKSGKPKGLKVAPSEEPYQKKNEKRERSGIGTMPFPKNK